MGYQVELVHFNKWQKQKDFFGLWDLICVGPHDIRFVQVKTNRGPDGKWKEKLRNWTCPKHAKIVLEHCVYKDYSRGNAPSARVTYPPDCSNSA
jgi:hypothetical protein